WITALEPNHAFARVRGLDHPPVNFGLRKGMLAFRLADVHHFRRLRNQVHHAPADEPVCEHDLGLADLTGGPDRQQVRIPRPGADKNNPALFGSSRTLGLVGRFIRHSGRPFSFSYACAYNTASIRRRAERSPLPQMAGWSGSRNERILSRTIRPPHPHPDAENLKQMAQEDRLPALNALRAFEAAARHLSFTRAAEELNVTPGAISQQIRQLEEFAGAPLFRRTGRQVLLTDAGQAALPLLTSAFEMMAEAVHHMRAPARRDRLMISSAPSFAAKWLAPRLERFQEQNPEAEVWVSADIAM